MNRLKQLLKMTLTLCMSLTLTASYLGCAADECETDSTYEEDLTVENSLAELEGALEVEEDFKGTVVGCVDALAACFQDETATSCVGDFKVCLPKHPKLFKKLAGPPGKVLSDKEVLDQVPEDADEEVDTELDPMETELDEEVTDAPKPKFPALKCVKHLKKCVSNEGDLDECVEKTSMCIKKVLTHRFHMLCKGAHKKCQNQEAPVQLCEKVSAVCQKKGIKGQAGMNGLPKGPQGPADKSESSEEENDKPSVKPGAPGKNDMPGQPGDKTDKPEGKFGQGGDKTDKPEGKFG
jgi:hypothetical protein